MSRKSVRWHVVRIIVWLYRPVALVMALVATIPEWWKDAVAEVREDARLLGALNDESEGQP